MTLQAFDPTDEIALSLDYPLLALSLPAGVPKGAPAPPGPRRVRGCSTTPRRGL